VKWGRGWGRGQIGEVMLVDITNKMKFLTKLFGDPNEKIIRSLSPTIDKINGLESEFSKKTNEQLKEITAKFKKDCPTENNQEYLNEILPQAFAVVREASKRTLGQRHYDVQLIGGIILHKGQIAEMKTGEGKTLVATLPLYLNSLSGVGAHLVTVNDYLASVGAGWMTSTYHLLGLTTGVIVHNNALAYDPEHIDKTQFDERLKHFKQVSRKEAYACDIIYGTNNEFGFDYLRDNMAPSLEAMVQRKLNYAIVDEIDSILIDEARTPLIISAPAEDPGEKYYQFAKLVSRLVENEDYNLDEKMRASTLTDAGISKMEKWLGIDNIYTTGGIREVHHIEQALKAHVIFKRDKDYVVKDDEVIIVDEFTGRLMNGRRYSDGLHQAIEAKEKVKIQRESMTMATITFQNYFRMYDKLSGMTGTAITEAEEFSKIYNLETVVIPTHRPIKRDDKNDLIYCNEEAKFRAVTLSAKEKNKKGQPVLIGTISIEKNELLAGFMEREGLAPQVLNAKNHQREAEIIANAGKPGAITIATNMAGRGVDIVLGGVEPSREAKSDLYEKWQKDNIKVKESGGLHVIGTERHESRRIDNQLRGRSGRQGDNGSSQFYVCTDDDLMRIFGGDRMKNIMTTLKLPEDMPIENKIITRSIESAQKKVEGNNFDTRKHLVEYDDVINKHREAIYKRRIEILESSENNQSESKKTAQTSNLSDIVFKMVKEEIYHVIEFHTQAEIIESWNIGEIKETIITILPIQKEELARELKKLLSSEKKDQKEIRDSIKNYLAELADKKYRELARVAKEAGIEWHKLEKDILIRSIDNAWVDHLSVMSSLRQGIGLRGYGQRDPLVEYKKEARRLYFELNNIIRKDVVYNIFKLGKVSEFNLPSIMQKAMQFSAPAKNSNGQTGSGFQQNLQKVKNEDGTKVGRNDPCPCKSGKKFKKCCMSMS